MNNITVNSSMISNTTIPPVLVQMMMSLGWQNVLLLHNGPVAKAFLQSMDTINFTYLDYDITSSTDEHLLTILKEVDDVVQPVLHLLLLCDHRLAVRVIQQMENFDARHNSSIDMRHSSRVIMMGNEGDAYTIQLKDSQVENVALVNVSSLMNISNIPGVRTLLFSPDGRAFSSVSLPSWSRVKTVSIFPNVMYGYNGRSLTVVMKDYTHPHGYQLVDGLNVSSPDYHILQYIIRNLNFSCNVVPPREDEWGRNIEGNWTGVIGMLQRKESDLAAERLTIHRERETVLDFVLPPIMENPLMILYKMEEKDDDTIIVYLRPFTSGLYIILAVTLLVYTFFLCFERRLHATLSRRVCREGNHQDTSTCSVWQLQRTFLSAFIENYQAAMRQASNTRMSRDSERFLVAFWWIFTIIISTIYCDVILASLTVKIEKPPFSNLADLAERLDYKIGYDSSSVEWIYFQMSNNSDIAKVRSRIREIAVRDPDVLSSEETKHFRRVQKGNYAFLGGIVTYEDMMRTNCKWATINTKLETRYLSFAVPKLSPFKKDFEDSMQQLQDSGIFQKVKEDWLRSIPEDKCQLGEFPRPISLRQLYGILIAVGVGICCSVVVLCGENIVGIRKNEKLHKLKS